jgi:hypothetical protein
MILPLLRLSPMNRPQHVPRYAFTSQTDRTPQESLSKGQQLATVLASKGKPLADLGQQLANRVEPSLAHGWQVTKERAQRVGSWVSVVRPLGMD